MKYRSSRTASCGKFFFQGVHAPADAAVFLRFADFEIREDITAVVLDHLDAAQDIQLFEDGAHRFILAQSLEQELTHVEAEIPHLEGRSDAAGAIILLEDGHLVTALTKGGRGSQSCHTGADNGNLHAYLLNVNG